MIKDAAGEAIFVKADVSQASEVEALVNKAVETYGRLDYAHNNAGIEGAMSSTVDCTEEIWDNTINVNLNGQSPRRCGQMRGSARSLQIRL